MDSTKGLTLKKLRVCLRDGIKRSKANRVHYLVWVEVKRREVAMG